MHGVPPLGHDKNRQVRTKHDDDNPLSQEKMILEKKEGVQKAVFEEMAYLLKNQRKW